jgi:hypothetical protein
VSDHFNELLNPLRVRKFAGYLLATHLFYQATESGDHTKVIPISVLLQETAAPLDGRDRLLRAKTIVSLAIAQQNLLGGDEVLPLLYEGETSGSLFGRNGEEATWIRESSRQ